MINQKIEELYESILTSAEYQKYLEISETLKKNKEVTSLINSIKENQKKATKLQYDQNNDYLLIDKKVKEQINHLNSYPIYIEYLNAKETLNDVLAIITKYIEDYINEKI